MFEGFARVWTPLVHVARIPRRRPLRLTLAGERLAVFRVPDGRFGVLLDACPHRGASLSLGRVDGAGCVACPFHEWRFDAGGAAVHVPLNPEAKRDRLFAQALPSLVIGELLWVYTDPSVRNAPAPPQVPEGLVSDRVTRAYLEVRWAAHWTRAMENMLDSPHVPFVHRATIGRAMQRYLTPASRMEIRWEATPYGGRSSMHLEGEPDEGRAWLDFYRPNVMALHIPIPGRHFHMHALCVPEERESVRLLVVGSRDFARSRLLNPFFNYANARVAAEDKAIVESSRPEEIPRSAEEVSVLTDRATLQFRRYYFEVLRGSSAAPRPRAGTSDDAEPPEAPTA